MGRRLRTYFPGGFFHVTARTQERQHWFDEPLRDYACEALAAIQRRVDVKVSAFVIMTNHLHLVLQQGQLPLASTMQPLLSRIARAVQRRHGVSGHVFGRRYWDHPCTTTEYLLACIDYVHRNPVRAEMCASAADYKWSSQINYLGQLGRTPVIVEPYAQFNSCDAPVVSVSSVGHGYSPCSVRPIRDLSDIVAYTIDRIAPGLKIEELRRLRGHAAAAIRRACIIAAADAGYRGCQIARFLGISDTAVSKVVVTLSRGNLPAAAWQDRPKG